MKVAQIWRYPVKSMAGERLEHARIGPLGIEGDRVVHVENRDGHVITARTHHRLLGHHATLNESGDPTVDGLLWSDPKVRADVEDIVGSGARLVRDDSSDRFDVLPLLVATDGAIAAFGHDGRRLRPNLVIGGVDGLAERSWPGQCLHIGGVIIGIQDLRGRCIMTTFDPDRLPVHRWISP
ncbi:MAG: MOSC N-terminal beta barrel domain-containing protein [Nitrospiraceae bacterium]|nr:MOSC N-terminal beta barrel domain-containing protein [Nitrospiraceae bacterium]